MKRPLVALVSILVIIASGVSLYLSQRQPSPRFNFKPFEGVGLVGAEEVAKLLGGQGRILVVAFAAESAPMETAVNSFLGELAKRGAFTVVTVERFKMSQPDMPLEQMGLAGTQYLELLAKYPNLDAIVSFVGPPVFPNRDYHAVPTTRPKFVSLSGYAPDLREQLELGVVDLAVVPRFEAPKAKPAEPQTPREWFDRYYTVATTETAGQLPEF